ncbi:hypothetical protein LCGC14_0845630 [marine sediment metagenome]|uniref:Uncharacterized protein n=1 Tax=marine sediment metagenome TaxID=412755 RepID=A0A0F9PX52_9ZZZZ
MFLKIVRGIEKIESLYECQRVHTHWAKGGEPLHFDLQTNNNEQDPGGNYGITIDFPEPAVIYLMSSEGKTVDTIEHKGWPPGPPDPPRPKGHHPVG